MGQECQQSDYTNDTYDKINFDIAILREKVIDVLNRIRDTPLYHLRAQWRLYKEVRDLNKQTDKIGERLKRLENDPIQILKRI